MGSTWRRAVRARAVVVLALAGVSGSAAGARAETPAEREALWMHRNLGAAYFADAAYAEAAKELARAAETSGSTVGDMRNAGVAALRAGDLTAARGQLERARTGDPKNAKALYALGILEKRESRIDAAKAALLECRAAGGEGPELHYNLGILASRANDFAAAESDFGAVVRMGPDAAPRHYASALYRQARTLLQLDRRPEGTALLERYQVLVKDGTSAQLSEEDLEAGELFELTSFERPSDVRAAGPLPAFRLAPIPAGDIRWAEARDFDRDGDTDLLLGDGQTVRDLRAQKGVWSDVTASRGLSGLLGVTSGRVFDVDNDGTVDLVRGGGGGVYVHPGDQGSWGPPIPVTKLAANSFIALDFDHEGDLDFLCLGPGGLAILRNNGDRTFTDVTSGSGLEGAGACLAAVAGDFDDDHDVDIVFLTRKGKLQIASNVRGGRFTLLEPIPAPDGAFDFAAGDLDNDGDLDVAVASATGVHLLRNDGKYAFLRVPTEPVIGGAVLWPQPGARSLWAADLDNDGRLDLVAARERETVFARNDGAGRFSVLPDAVRALTEKGLRPTAVTLVDGDGRLDIVSSSGSEGVARNVGTMDASLILDPVGAENNVDAVGSTFELLAGPLLVRRDGSGGPVHLGIGTSRIDALRVRWPNGIQQAIIAPKPGSRIEVKEKPGLVGSCPFLYVWNGTKHEFVTDVLTVTPLGLPIMPGTYVPPNWDEAIRVTSEQMRPDANGDLVAQVTEELREVTYLDQVRLYAIDHPAGTEVQPNEKFKFPPFPEFGVHLLDAARAPVTAIDHRGRDVTEKLLFTDDAVAGDLTLTRYGGIVEMHSLTLDFGEVPPDAPLTLHLSGWFHWTQASINMALFQDPRYDFIPPFIEVQAPSGDWEKLPAEVGFPGGKTKSIPVDLTGVFPGGRAVLRVTTSLRLYWDRALLQVGRPATEPRVTMILPASAQLRFRGHSEPILSVTGEEPERFDYDVLRTEEVPWDQHPGMYTKYGDVTPLVQDPEDMYVVMASGDECTVRWRAQDLPSLEPNTLRTYFLVFDGWAKDGDLNTTWAETVEPLPFHAMSGYPYRDDEKYPFDEPHETYRQTWNTRSAIRLTRDFAAAALAPGGSASGTE